MGVSGSGRGMGDPGGGDNSRALSLLLCPLHNALDSALLGILLRASGIRSNGSVMGL